MQGNRLTREQSHMLAMVIDNPAMAWTTNRKGPAYPLLIAWEKDGYFKEVTAPADFLAAFQITPAGRRALEAEK